MFVYSEGTACLVPMQRSHLALSQCYHFQPLAKLVVVVHMHVLHCSSPLFSAMLISVGMWSQYSWSCLQKLCGIYDNFVAYVCWYVVYSLWSLQDCVHFGNHGLW